MNIYAKKYQQAYFIYNDILPMKKRGESFSEDDLARAYGMGMYRLEELKLGHMYLGKCRNAFMAQWNGEQFVYAYWEMTAWAFEFVPHAEHYEGYDVFVPLLNLNEYIQGKIFE